jgi:hypothetical protein
MHCSEFRDFQQSKNICHALAYLAKELFFLFRHGLLRCVVVEMRRSLSLHVLLFASSFSSIDAFSPAGLHTTLTQRGKSSVKREH